MQAFILAGGFATRLWPLTEKRAKPLLPLAGKPLLTHLVENIPEGIEITVSTNATFAEDFAKWKNKQAAKDRITILIEDAGHEDEKLGALGAVAQWIRDERIEDDVLLLAGDNYIGFSIADLIAQYKGNPLLAAHDIKEKEKAKLFGTVICEDTRVTAFEEKPEEPKSTLISTGCYVLSKETLPVLIAYAKDHPDNIGSIFTHFLDQNIDVDCASFSEPWFDIGSFDAYLEATQALVGENFLLGESSAQEGSTLEGSVVLGKSSQVKQSSLKNVVLFEGCNIEDCVLENCIVDNSCNLRGVDLTGKMLREGTQLVR
jgi:glucose-1-phosphate thymidylyltransferase